EKLSLVHIGLLDSRRIARKISQHAHNKWQFNEPFCVIRVLISDMDSRRTIAPYEALTTVARHLRPPSRASLKGKSRPKPQVEARKNSRRNLHSGQQTGC